MLGWIIKNYRREYVQKQTCTLLHYKWDFFLARELAHLFPYVWKGAKNEWTEGGASREIRPKNSVASSFDSLSFIKQLHNNFVPTSAFIVRLVM